MSFSFFFFYSSFLISFFFCIPLSIRFLFCFCFLYFFYFAFICSCIHSHPLLSFFLSLLSSFIPSFFLRCLVIYLFNYLIYLPPFSLQSFFQRCVFGVYLYVCFFASINYDPSLYINAFSVSSPWDDTTSGSWSHADTRASLHEV